MFSDGFHGPDASHEEALSYRHAMSVTEARRITDSYYPVCPRCAATLDREYQRYCDRCGQHLSWKSFRRIGKKGAKRAGP